MGFESPKNNSDVPREYDKKVQEVLEILGVEYSESEKKSFDNWKENLPSSSVEEPLKLKGVNQVLDLIPRVPNYLNESVGFFFELEDQKSSLEDILREFAFKNLDFEIAILKFGEVAWLEIGSKTGHSGPSGEDYIGHIHPTKILDNVESSRIFSDGLLPSPGDVKGYLKKIETITSGTIICSRFGKSTIKPSSQKIDVKDSEIQDYASKYFGEFLGENNFSAISEEEWKKFFNDKFGLEVSFEKYDTNSLQKGGRDAASGDRTL